MNLKEIRERIIDERGRIMTQDEAARRVGCSPRTWRRAEAASIKGEPIRAIRVFYDRIKELEREAMK